MKIEFLKDDFKYYLGGMIKMHVSKKGDSIEVDAETADRWIKKEVAKIAESKVKVVEVTNTINTGDFVPAVNDIEEEKPLHKKRGRKKKVQ